MNWYNINQAQEITKKSSRTIRLYLQKYKQSNSNLKADNNIFKYEIDSGNNKKLYVSELFLQTYFNVEKQPLQKGVATPEKDISTIENNNEIQTLEQKYEKRLETMQQFFEKQLNEVKDAKQETIDLLAKQLDKADYQLNKVLEQYSMAQLTIQNLTIRQESTPIRIQENNIEDYQETEEEKIEIIDNEEKEQSVKFKQLDLEEEIENIIQEKQATTKPLRTTEQYMKQEKPNGSDKSFAFWLNKLKSNE